MIELDAVHYTYPTGTHAIDGLSLSIGDDESYFVLGHNGAGKSTLLRLFNGLLKPTSGKVIVDGVDTTTVRPAQLARTAALMFQNPDAQLFHERVRDEIRFGVVHGGLKGARVDAVDERIDRALGLLELTEVSDANPYDLSLSMRKRVAMASVIAMSTPVVVLDEPTGGQDLLGMQLIGRLIEQLRSEGRTVVVVTHDVDLAFAHADRVLVLLEGRHHLEGDPDEVLGDPGLESAGVEPSTLHTIWKELDMPGSPSDEEALVEMMSGGRG